MENQPVDYDSLIKQAKLARAINENEATKLKLLLIQMRFRPSLNMPVTVRREGGHWVCALETSEDILDCPVAYGSSPQQAMVNFDHLWIGTGHVMADAEEIEEQENDEDDEDESEDDYNEDEHDLEFGPDELDELIDSDDDGEEF